MFVTGQPAALETFYSDGCEFAAAYGTELDACATRITTFFASLGEARGSSYPKP